MAKACTKCLLMLINRLRNLDRSEGQRLYSQLCFAPPWNHIERELLPALQMRPALDTFKLTGIQQTEHFPIQSFCICFHFREEWLDYPLKISIWCQDVAILFLKTILKMPSIHLPPKCTHVFQKE